MNGDGEAIIIIVKETISLPSLILFVTSNKVVRSQTVCMSEHKYHLKFKRDCHHHHVYC